MDKVKACFTEICKSRFLPYGAFVHFSFPKACGALLALSLLLQTGCVQTSGLSQKTRNLVYAERGNRALKLDLYLPDTPPPKSGYPLIVCFHGGGWVIGSKERDLFLQPMLKKGYALASVQYRLSGGATFPAQIEDARDSLRWLIDNASRYQLDKKRIGAFGPSAGGHLALLLGLGETKRFADSKPFPSDTIKAICALYPPTDLIGIIPVENRGKTSNLVARLLGGPIRDRMELAVLGSPTAYVTRKSPPVLLIHGDRDMLVPLAQSQQLEKSMKKSGAPVQLIVLPGKIHGFGLSPQMLKAVETFYDQNLK